MVATQDAALINNFRVYVRNIDAIVHRHWRYRYRVCGRRYIAKKGPNVLQCGHGIRGRYVFVYADSDTAIALHEVEVYTKRVTE